MMSPLEWQNPKQAYIYLAGHGLLILSFIFFTVGFATNHWLAVGRDGMIGLWFTCFDNLCSYSSPDYPSWFIATRAMQTMALICYMSGLLLALFFNCITQTLPGECSRGKARVLELLIGLGNIFCLIGVSVFGSKGDKDGTLEYSYVLSVFSLILSSLGILMVASTRNSVTNRISIAPRTQHFRDPSLLTLAATTNSSEFPQTILPRGDGSVIWETHIGPRYPYGCGQQNVDSNMNNGCGSGGSSYSAYGSCVVPSLFSHQLPTYPLHPLGPVEPARVSDSEGGSAFPNGQPRSSSRLPPVPAVVPTAPVVASQEDQPPSYMEAIGHSQC